MFFFFVGECKGGNEVTQVLGCTDISACINEQPWSTKTCCDSYQRKMQAICVEAAFFVSSICWISIPPPAPAVHTAPSRAGQQEIGIQCFLDDFLKEMNLSRKMRTMNNETLDGMCLTHAIHTSWAVAESHV